jgi:hypothetical protein
MHLSLPHPSPLSSTGLSSDWSATTCLRTPNSFRKEFTHSSPSTSSASTSSVFDSSGLLFYLGTLAAAKYPTSVSGSSATTTLSSASATSPSASVTAPLLPLYLNPQSVGMVRVSMSSLLNSFLSNPSQVIDHCPVGYNCTGLLSLPPSLPPLSSFSLLLSCSSGGDSPGQWISIDLTEGKLFHPTAYALRSSQVSPPFLSLSASSSTLRPPLISLCSSSLPLPLRLPFPLLLLMLPPVAAGAPAVSLGISSQGTRLLSLDHPPPLGLAPLLLVVVLFSLYRGVLPPALFVLSAQRQRRGRQWRGTAAAAAAAIPDVPSDDDWCEHKWTALPLPQWPGALRHSLLLAPHPHPSSLSPSPSPSLLLGICLSRPLSL